MWSLREPPLQAVNAALEAALQSPCAKSKRGVAAFIVNLRRDPLIEVVATGFNGPPGGISCDGSVACRADCAKRCVHAESRALRQASSAEDKSVLGRLQLVHVKVNVQGTLVAGRGPSCWQCSREILDVGLAGVWLYEDVRMLNGRWRFYDASTFHRVTCEAAEVGGPR